jgi:hypothetical protein
MSPRALSETFESWPPGIVFIFSRLPKALILPLSVYLVSIFARNALNLNAPNWLVTIAAIAAIPLVLVVSINWETFKDKRAANALGAVMAPQVPSKWLAGLDIIRTRMNNRKEGHIGTPYQLLVVRVCPLRLQYIGDIDLKLTESIGHIFCFRTLYVSRVKTLFCCPIMHIA